MVTELKLPTVGENVAKANIVKVLVAPGDTVRNDQAVIEIDTDKATLEVPSDVSGTVKDVLVKQGQDVEVGQVLMTIEEGEVAAKPAAKAPEKSEKPAEKTATKKAE